MGNRRVFWRVWQIVLFGRHRKVERSLDLLYRSKRRLHWKIEPIIAKKINSCSFYHVNINHPSNSYQNVVWVLPSFFDWLLGLDLMLSNSVVAYNRDSFQNMASENSWEASKPWINQITWPNSCKSSCTMTFLFYKMSSWKFGKCNRKRWRMSVNFVWVKILQKVLHLAVLVDNILNIFKNFY